MQWREPYQSVLGLLLCLAIAGLVASLVAVQSLGNPVFLDGTVACWLAIGMLAGVVSARAARLETDAGQARRTRRGWEPLTTVVIAGALMATVHVRLIQPSPLVPSAVAAAGGVLAAWLAMVAAQYLETVTAGR